MRTLALTLAALFAAMPAHAQNQAIWESWGKAHVSFDQYRSDAVECGRAGVHIDIANTAPVQALKRGTREMEANDQGAQAYSAGATPEQLMDQTVVLANQYQRIREHTRADVQVAKVKGMMLTETEACLAARGYSRFRLTGDQHRHLARLRVGKPERHEYLYRLASDPAVLTNQAVPVTTH
jgi:hypothetical protein